MDEQTPMPQTTQVPVSQPVSPVTPPSPVGGSTPPIVEQPIQMNNSSDAPKPKSNALLFSIITIIIIFAAVGGGLYMLGANNQSQIPQETTPQPTPVYTNPTPSQNEINEQSEKDIDSEVMQIDEDLNSISSASAEIDSGLNDKSTNLTP